MYSGFGFIVEPITTTVKVPVEVVPEHFIRKANDQEIEQIKKQISRFSSHPDMVYLLYEANIKQQNGNRAYLKLNKTRWKYNVITFPNTNEKIQTLEFACSLIEHDFSIGFEFLKLEANHGTVIGHNPNIVSTYYNDNLLHPSPKKCLLRHDLRDIGRYYRLIGTLENSYYANIYRAIFDYNQTKMITNKSSLKPLMYFAILECVLTHDPKETDTLDSLSRQIRTKMALLTKRFTRKVEHERFFPEFNNIEALWRQLYSYRSQLSHGAEVKFSGKNKLLVSHDIVREYLKDNLKLLLAYAIENPEFVTDLQRC